MTNETVVHTKHTLTVDEAVKINTALRGLEHVALDTETAYSPEDDLCETVTSDGTVVTWKRSLDVDGPGVWRVTTIAGLAHDGTAYGWCFDMDGMDLTVFGQIVEGISFHAWNARFDRGVLNRDGVYPAGWTDLPLADAILRTGSTGGDIPFYRSLAEASRVYLGVNMDGKGSTQLSFDAHTPLSDEQVRYAIDDAINTARLGKILMGRVAEEGLQGSFDRNNGAQPFINSMVVNGLPIDVEGYLNTVVIPATRKAAAAAEQVALLTSGADLLRFVGEQTGVSGSTTVEEQGREVLGDSEKFAQLISTLETVTAEAEQNIAEAAGGTVIQEDLFSAGGGQSIICPFGVDDDNDVRKWLSKTAPIFASTIVATSLHPDLDVEQVENAAVNNREQLREWSAGKTRIVAAHNLDTDVLVRLQKSTAPDVDDALRTVATQLLTYRKAKKFLAEYGTAVAPVRLQPDWKVNNSQAAKNAFNTYAPDTVKAYFRNLGKGARLFVPSDSLTSDTLTLLGGPLAEALSTYRHNEKLVSTYGDRFLAYVHPLTGRIHARYKQALTGTHRLSSEAPNAQNFSPLVKPFIRPADGKVLICADLSQAELRFLADIAQDRNMLDAFAAGEDLHERTSALMFDIDMGAIKTLAGGTVPEGMIVSENEVIFSDDTTEAFRRGFDAVIAAAEQPYTVPALAAVAGKVYKTNRYKAKKVSFGYAYGIGAEKLAHGMTVDGVDTSADEARELIERFNVAYPQAAAWMRGRVEYITAAAASIRNGATRLDWSQSWQLHTATSAVRSARTTLGKNASAEDVSVKVANDTVLRTRIASQKYHIGMNEVSDEQRDGVSDSDLVTARNRHVAVVRWVDSFDEPTVLGADGKPWMFASETAGGAKRRFPLLTKDWEWGIIVTALRSRDPNIKAAINRWVVGRSEAEKATVEAKRTAGQRANNPNPIVLFDKNGRPLRGKELEKQFEDRTRRTSLVEYLAWASGGGRELLYREGAADRVRGMVNQYRNHPIQGGVADAMLEAMTVIDRELDKVAPGAKPIQSVHDSIVIECDRSQASAVLTLCVSAMEAGLNLFAPTVVAKADGDVQLTLDDKSKISPDSL